jgi:hypothetical protein
MKAQFESKEDLSFSQVLELRSKIFQRFGEADFIAGELQFASVPLAGPLNLALEGLELDSLSVECRFPRGKKSLAQLREVYQHLEPAMPVQFVFCAGYEFRIALEPSGKPYYMSLMTVQQKRSFSFNGSVMVPRKYILQRAIEIAQVPARIVDEDGLYFIEPDPPDSGVTGKGTSTGGNPSGLDWPAIGSATDVIGTAEHLACGMADDPEKGITCSWQVSTIMSEGASDLVTFLNGEKLILPKGRLDFSYCLKELEGLDRVRALLGPKANLSAEAAVFRYLGDPDEDRGVLWVRTTPNGYKVELHLDDPDRIKELQRYLGVKFQWKKTPD